MSRSATFSAVIWQWPPTWKLHFGLAKLIGSFEYGSTTKMDDSALPIPDLEHSYDIARSFSRRSPSSVAKFFSHQVCIARHPASDFHYCTLYAVLLPKSFISKLFTLNGKSQLLSHSNNAIRVEPRYAIFLSYRTQTLQTWLSTVAQEQSCSYWIADCHAAIQDEQL